MATVRVFVERDVFVTDEADPEDEWSRESTAATIESIEARLVERNEPSYRSKWRGLDEDFELDVKRGDTVYAVIADYDTGDTFGRDGNQVSVVGCFKQEDRAKGLLNALRDAGPNAFSTKFMGEEYYIGWNGYFEHLNDLDIHPLVVR